MDYDVEVLGLQTPPASAVVTRYRPAVQVRNNGIHDAIASGYVRIYSAGLLIFESAVYSNTIEPGETGLAEAVQYWTPPAEGPYMVQGYVSTPLDQVEPNNNLNPTIVTVGPGQPPTPPTPVEPHAAQHEEGGGDELSIEGLRGRTADQQEPVHHASDHEAGGDDAMNVSGMPGVLTEPQIPKAHAASHEVTGLDPLNIDDIPGADGYEKLENKGQPAGYAGLGANGVVPAAQLATGSIVTDGTKYLRMDQLFDSPIPVGLICAWDSSSPIPDGWVSVLVSPGLILPYIWIKYNGTGGGI